jgi:NAD(P)-dependent dehydrogenase (short-subunit alcohol dehydrogenase family)
MREETLTRVVLVTGGTSGMGRAIATRFAADQAQVFIMGRHADTVERAAKELGVRGVVCDATVPEQVEALSSGLGEVLDVLVNAAGGLRSPPRNPGRLLTRSRAGSGLCLPTLKASGGNFRPPGRATFKSTGRSSTDWN